MNRLIKKTNCALWVSVFAMLTMTTYASEEKDDPGKFFESEGKGWFWYEEPIEEPEEPEPEKKPPPPAEIPEKNPAKNEPIMEDQAFSVEWLRKQMPILRDRAINNPTEENMAAYMYANRMMMDRAHQFSNQFKRLAQKDPYLSENIRYPFDAVSKVAMMRDMDNATDEVISKNRDRFALWYFHDAKCIHCVRQVEPLIQFANKHGVKVEVISKTPNNSPPMFRVRKDSGQFQMLGLKVRPAIALVVPPDNVSILSEGVVTQAEIESRLLVALDDLGMISKELYERIHPMDKGVLDSSELEFNQSIDPDDPASWLPHLRKTMGAEDDLYFDDDSLPSNKGKDNEKD